MSRNILRFLLIATGIPVIVCSAFVLIMWLAVGQPSLMVLLPLILFMLGFGLLAAILDASSERLYRPFRYNRQDWESIRLGGKWRYVVRFSLGIDAMVLSSLVIFFFITPREVEESVQPIIALGLLILITILAAFWIALAAWNRHEREYEKSSI